MGQRIRKTRAPWRRVVSGLVTCAVLCGALGGTATAQVSAPTEGDPVGVVWVLVGETVEVDLSSAFAGTVDSYAASSSTPSTVTVSVSGSVVSVTASTKSTSRVNYSASNTAGSASGSFGLRVLAADDPPQTHGPADSLELGAGDAATEVDISAHFSGPVDSYAATVAWSYPAVSGAGAYVDVSMSGSVLSVRPLRAGLAGIAVTATNSNGSASIDTWATVTGTAPAPAASGTFEDQTVTAGTAQTVEVAAAFTGVVDSYSATSSDTTKLTVSTTGSIVTLTGVAPGSATITVTATNPAGTANQTIDVTVVPLVPPIAVGGIGTQRLVAGYSLNVDVASAFAGIVDSYSALSTRPAVASVRMNGSTLTLRGRRPGLTPVAVFATNSAGSARQSLLVYVRLLLPPRIADTLAAREVGVGYPLDVDVASGFSGIVESYAASSSDETIVTAATDGSTLTLTGVAAGTATVTVTATNPAGNATQTITITALVAPTATGTLLAQDLAVGATADVDVAAGFSGIVRTYTASSSDETIVAAATDGSTLTLTGVAAGTATVTVTATNPAGNATQTITITALVAPTATGTLPAQDVAVGSTTDVDVAAGFSGIVRSYTATSSDETKVTATIAGSTVTLTGVTAGEATVTVTATNPAGEATQTLTVTALVAPTATGTLPAQTVEVGSTTTLDVAAGFSGIVRTYTATSSDETKVTTTMNGSTLTLTGIAAGTATVTITASNAAGSATQTITITINPAVEEVREYDCPDDYTLHMEQNTDPTCKRTITVPATAATTSRCPTGFSPSGSRCSRPIEVSAHSASFYYCPSSTPSWTLNGTTCTRTITEPAAPPTPPCDPGWTVSGEQCTRTITKPAVATTTYSCPSDYTLSGTSCTTYETYPANGYICYPGDVLVGITCVRITTISATETVTYSCDDGWSLSGQTCSKTETQGQNAEYERCKPGWSLSGQTCSKTETMAASVGTTYWCDSGFSLVGRTCHGVETANRITTVIYSCGSDYSPNGTNCEKVVEEDPTVSITYRCPHGYVVITRETTRDSESGVVRTCSAAPPTD